MKSSSNKTKSQESYISNQDALKSLMEIQKKLIGRGKSLKTICHGRDARSCQHV